MADKKGLISVVGPAGTVVIRGRELASYESKGYKKIADAPKPTPAPVVEEE